MLPTLLFGRVQHLFSSWHTITQVLLLYWCIEHSGAPGSCINNCLERMLGIFWASRKMASSSTCAALHLGGHIFSSLRHGTPVPLLSVQGRHQSTTSMVDKVLAFVKKSGHVRPRLCPEHQPAQTLQFETQFTHTYAHIHSAKFGYKLVTMSRTKSFLYLAIVHIFRSGGTNRRCF